MNDDTMKSSSVTAASNPTKNDSKRKYFYENPQFFGEMRKEKSRNMEIEKKRTKRAKISSEFYHEQK